MSDSKKKEMESSLSAIKAAMTEVRMAMEARRGCTPAGPGPAKPPSPVPIVVDEAWEAMQRPAPEPPSDEDLTALHAALAVAKGRNAGADLGGLA